jgi:hypothetical protein
MARSLTKIRESESALKIKVQLLQGDLESREILVQELQIKTCELEDQINSIKSNHEAIQVALDDEKNRLQSRLVEADKSSDDLAERYRKLKERAALREERVSALAERVGALESSTSYRIGLVATAPVRWFKRLAQRNIEPPSK